MSEFKNSSGKSILLKIVEGIQDNKDYLSEVDGLIGDGDHGVNMNKGFTIFGERIRDKDISFSEGLEELGNILLTEIGGSMGPIYGMLFIGMGEQTKHEEYIDLKKFYEMMNAGAKELYEIVEARVGDKTLVDTLQPALDSLEVSVEADESFKEALENMKKSAEIGKNSTKDLTARYGRASRLGERSKGVLDAGSVSCNIILREMANGIIDII